MSPLCSNSLGLHPACARAPVRASRNAGRLVVCAAAKSGGRRNWVATPPAAAAASTLGPPQGASWEAWLARLPDWASSTLTHTAWSGADASALSSAVKKAATTYVPRRSVSIPSLDTLGEVPVNLHARLALCARVTLLGYLSAAGHVGDVSAVVPGKVEATTTDIAAALEAAGVVVEKKGKRTAYVSLVVTETERQMTWSRLEGLALHWAVSSAPPPSQHWELPPRGWVTAPDTTLDAGGAWQTVFEKHPLPQPDGSSGPESLYSLVVGVPLEGPLRQGGLVFVLKSGNTGHNTAWLKDAGSRADFYIDLHAFPTVKA